MSYLELTIYNELTTFNKCDTKAYNYLYFFEVPPLYTFIKTNINTQKTLQMGIMMLITYLLQVNKIVSDISILSLYAVYYEYFVSS